MKSAERWTQARHDLQEALGEVRASPGSEIAWRRLYAHALPFIAAAARPIVHYDSALVEDVCQTVFLQLVRTRPFERLHSIGAFPAYLRTMAVRSAIELTRRPGTSDLSLDDPAARIEPPVSPMGDTPDRLLDAELLLSAMLAELDPTDQRLVVMLLEGRSMKEMAEASGLVYATAAVRLHRLRRRLRRFLREYER